MFERNDRFWFFAHTIVYILLGINIVAAIVLPIVYAFILKNWILIIYIIPSLIACVIFWVFAELFFRFLLDVKFIRNKIYGEENTDFEQFLGEKKVERIKIKPSELNESFEVDKQPQKNINKTIEPENEVRETVKEEEETSINEEEETSINGYYNPYDE